MITNLHDSLCKLTIDELKPKLTLLACKAPSHRKADLIKTIEEKLTGASLRKLWHSFSELEQQALAEACHTPGHPFEKDRIAAKYGKCPPLFKTPKGLPSYSSSRRTPTRLSLFFFRERYADDPAIPRDLGAELMTFVPPPPSPTVETITSPADEPELTIRETSEEALQDLFALLRLAEQGQVKATAKTGMPTATAGKVMLNALSGGDFYPPELAHPPNKPSWEAEIGPIKPVGWIRLLQVSGYLTGPGKTSALTRAGLKALTRPGHEVLRELWEKWLGNKTFDEFQRVDQIKGQKTKGTMTPAILRRDAVVGALEQCPAGKWIETSAFSSFMIADGYDFEITRRPHKLYLGDAHYGNFGYDGYGRWDVLQLRYLLALLFEYAAPLGLIDLAYVPPKNALPGFREQWGTDDLSWLSRYDGLRAFRITRLGAWCLGLTPTFTPPRSLSPLRFDVTEDLSIHLLSPSIPPADSLFLATWTKSVHPGQWKLDSALARDAIERGHSEEELRTFLHKHSDSPLPTAVEEMIASAREDSRALQSLGAASLFQCRDVETAEQILESKSLQKLCSRCSETKLVVLNKNLKKFQSGVRKLGLGFAPD